MNSLEMPEMLDANGFSINPGDYVIYNSSTKGLVYGYVEQIKLQVGFRQVFVRYTVRVPHANSWTRVSLEKSTNMMVVDPRNIPEKFVKQLR